jgi:PTS system nitrogen regulatory IIA component
MLRAVVGRDPLMAILDSATTLDTPLVILEMRVRRRDAALQLMTHGAAATDAVRDEALVLEALARRERVVGSAQGRGVALAHARSVGVMHGCVVFARAARGIDWHAADGEPVALVWLVLSPAECGLDRHRERVAHAARAVRLQRQRQRLVEAADEAALRALLQTGGTWMTSAT